MCEEEDTNRDSRAKRGHREANHPKSPVNRAISTALELGNVVKVLCFSMLSILAVAHRSVGHGLSLNNPAI